MRVRVAKVARMSPGELRAAITRDNKIIFLIGAVAIIIVNEATTRISSVRGYYYRR